MSVEKIFKNLNYRDNEQSSSTNTCQDAETFKSIFGVDYNIQSSDSNPSVFSSQQAPTIQTTTDNFSKSSSTVANSEEEFQKRLIDIKNKLIANGKEAGLSEDVINKIKSNEIVLETKDYGAARYEKGKIFFNYNANRQPPSDAQLSKLLIHEAVHSSKSSIDNKFNTQEEEAEAERTALTVTANLIKQGKISDEYSEYTDANGKKIKYSEFSNGKKIDSTINNWLNQYYRGVIHDKESLAVTVDKVPGENSNQIKIRKGDVFNINGKEFKIGENGVFLEGIQGSNAFQLCRGGPPPKTIGFVLFEGTQYSEKKLPRQINEIFNNENGTAITIKQDNKLLKGKIYNLDF